MSRYDGLIIPRSYSEYLNKTDSATLSQMLQHLTELWSHAVAAGDNKPVTSDAVYEALTDAATIQQALQLPGVLSGAVAAGDNKAVTSNAVNSALAEYINKTDAATLQQALQLPGVLSGAVAAGDNKAVTSNAVYGALMDKANKTDLASYVRCFDSVPGNDWNNAIEEGTYNINTDSVASNILNRPAEFAVKVIVKTADTNDLYYIYQTAYTCYYSIRIRVQKQGGSWSEWKTLIQL